MSTYYYRIGKRVAMISYNYETQNESTTVLFYEFQTPQDARRYADLSNDVANDLVIKTAMERRPQKGAGYYPIVK